MRFRTCAATLGFFQSLSISSHINTLGLMVTTWYFPCSISLKVVDVAFSALTTMALSPAANLI
ncbi:hypothetical protein BDZ94DRAFT_1274063 [Collybia nuda]|uniref:Uncharacterized protein n=1 Tax=Collybia nuda TaxID=64659 RepID=A0A9P6CCF7_9AGAR|nr:hypothetical protein BDZ94DRAFT_1274063 [Collybia nuda]